MPAAPVGGHYDLTDHFGRAVTPSTFSEKYTLFFFGFTHCKVVCPENLEKLSRAVRESGVSSAALQPLYVTVDPERDTPARMREFLGTRFPLFLGLTGDREQIDEVRRQFKVFAQRRADPGDPSGYDVPHSAYSFLMEPGGACAAYFPPAATAAEIAAKLRAVVL